VKVVFLPTAEAVLAVNKYIGEQGGNPAHCFEVGKIESAISTAFYPGAYPFAHGGLPFDCRPFCPESPAIYNNPWIARLSLLFVVVIKLVICIGIKKLLINSSVWGEVNMVRNRR
jgi:hypothetical protein